MMNTEHSRATRDALLLRYAQEALYCERILAKTGDTIVTATLAHISEPTFWTHYPDGDVFDAASGAQWYYHSHAPDTKAQAAYAGSAVAGTTTHAHHPDDGEHGHFHCFVRPQGKPGPIHHVVAISVDSLGALRRLFTVAQHVVDDDALPADERIRLLEKFDVQLARPDYLVNRWLTAIIGLYQDDIATLIQQGDTRATIDNTLAVTAELETTLLEKSQSLEGFRT